MENDNTCLRRRPLVNSLTSKQHNLAKSINFSIQQISTNEWIVDKYCIRRNPKCILKNCIPKCHRCNICIHDFTCQCYDFVEVRLD
ncbi:hypothetical protein BLOT_009795 [Blomia tropicalis]|nr:hypothetical protein BLOT_009795 [Blomia tropicalis]